MDQTLTTSTHPAGAATDTTPPTLAIVLEGGLVQAVVSDRPDAIRMNVRVIDYDTDGADDDRLSEVPQGDGSVCYAFVEHHDLTEAGIDLDRIANANEPDQ